MLLISDEIYEKSYINVLYKMYKQGSEQVNFI